MPLKLAQGDNPSPHSGQMKFALKCVFMCCLTFSFLKNAYPDIPHWNFFSLMCARRCCRNSWLSAKPSPHMGHTIFPFDPPPGVFGTRWIGICWHIFLIDTYTSRRRALGYIFSNWCGCACVDADYVSTGIVYRKHRTRNPWCRCEIHFARDVVS